MKKDLSSPKPLGLGILGAGLAVRHLHWPALQRLTDQYTITQICDVDLAAAQGIAELVGGAPVTTDARAFLANPQVDAVLISLPIHLTAEMLLAAARAGKHVICEKPVAASLEQARHAVEALAGAAGVIAIAENYHFRPDIVQAATWVREGRIGRVTLVTSEGLFWTDTAKGFGSTPWRQDPQYRGAVITDGGVHNAAGLRELGGEVEQLQAFIKDVHPVMGGTDTMVLNLRFRNGALGALLFSGAAQASGPDRPEFRVFGTEGSVVVSQGTARLLPGGAGPNDGEDGETFTTPKDQGGGYYEEFQDFFAAIREGRPPRVSPADALRDLEIILRAVDSAESRSVILL